MASRDRGGGRRAWGAVGNGSPPAERDCHFLVQCPGCFCWILGSQGQPPGVAWKVGEDLWGEREQVTREVFCRCKSVILYGTTPIDYFLYCGISTYKVAEDEASARVEVWVGYS